VAVSAPGRFAALADVAGVPWVAQDYSKVQDTPLLFVEAGKDAVHALDDARRYGFLLQRRVKRFEYATLPAAGHDDAAAAALPAVFDFFEAVRGGAWKPSGRPIPLPSTSR
jgi:hypothetical protein